MTLRQLEYLVALVEERSFTRAAERLGVSQPALSHQVRALETSVGEALVERLPAGVRLTPQGRAFLPHAAAALRSAERVRRLGHPEDARVVLRIAAVASLALGFLPPAIGRWKQLHPDAQVELIELTGGEELARVMASGLADVGVGPIGSDWEGDVEVIGREELVIVVGEDDPLAGRKSVELSALADRAWVLLARENSLSAVVDQACAEAGFSPAAAVRTRHTTTAVALAAAGLGPALVPRAILGTDLDAVVVEPSPAVGREVRAATLPGAGPAVVDFLVELRRTGATLASRG